jgi:hypothetical protein
MALDKNWSESYPTVHTTSEKELAHLETYIRQFKDARFEYRLKEAMQEFHGYRNNTNDDLSYTTDRFSVRPVPHFAELRYGIHFTDTDEYGLYTFFLADNREKPYIGFYRSDAAFQKEIPLDALLIDEAQGLG